MRYAAHPSPDALLYGLMIRACASPSFCNGVEPERALDLFTEMTVQQGIPPNAGTYIAIILACARSGRRAYVHEAFRLAKQMLDAHRDARGASEFRPSKRLFCALLEGAKRIGDLARARWILAEMIRTSREEQEEHGGATEPSVKVDQEVMLHVFQTYAAYKLPFKRSETVIVEQTSDAPVSPSPTNSNRSEATDVEPVPETNSTFLHIPPQDRAALLAEVDTLFSQIVELRNQAHDDVSHNFRFVEVTPQLLNAYLSVHYARSSPRVCHDLYRKLFSGLGVQKIPRIHIEALERCTNARKGPDRIDALKFAEEIWEEWRPLETKWRNRESDPLAEIVTPRQVERATAAMVRVYSV